MNSQTFTDRSSTSGAPNRFAIPFPVSLTAGLSSSPSLAGIRDLASGAWLIQPRIAPEAAQIFQFTEAFAQGLEVFLLIRGITVSALLLFPGSTRQRSSLRFGITFQWSHLLIATIQRNKGALSTFCFDPIKQVGFPAPGNHLLGLDAFPLALQAFPRHPRFFQFTGGSRILPGY